MKKLSWLLVATSLVALSACEPLTLASTAVIGVGMTEERSAGDKIDDNIIQLKIKEKYLQAEASEILSRVSVSCMEGRVLLSGSVGDFKYSQEAEKLAWQTRNVREVINEIEVGNKTPKDRAQDLFIISAINSKLLLEQDLKSSNYIVDANDGVAFLLGIAQDDLEMRKAMKIASQVKGVKKVVNHVILKSDSRRSK